ncbi:hypothetical protein ACLK19_25025 [Escherichia coli]
MLLGILGFFIIAILASRNIHAAVLVSIVVTTLLAGCWVMSTTLASFCAAERNDCRGPCRLSRVI